MNYAAEDPLTVGVQKFGGSANSVMAGNTYSLLGGSIWLCCVLAWCGPSIQFEIQSNTVYTYVFGPKKKFVLTEVRDIKSESLEHKVSREQCR